MYSVYLCYLFQVTTDHRDSTDRVNLELEQLGDGSNELQIEEDGLAALKQVPAPIYALDTLLAVLTIMARSVALVEPDNFSDCLNLVGLFELIHILCRIKIKLYLNFYGVNLPTEFPPKYPLALSQKKKLSMQIILSKLIV